MTEKSASVHWQGQGKKGEGQISTETDALQAYPYGFGSRFEDDRRGTNPEELLGAAHAACFTMAFSFACDKAGFATESVDTQAKVRLVPHGGRRRATHLVKSGRDPFAVPAGRLARLAHLGSLASGLAGGMLAEGARQLGQGRRPKISDLLLTPANARRVAEQLARLRGAAMKVGQLLSMDAGDLLPPELGEILSRLRADARPMPISQLIGVLNEHWGEGWEQHFTKFSFTPLAAASIGQVHSAQDQRGRRLAIKVQYPGVRHSISSDVDNVASLLRISGLLPKSLDIQPLLDEAKCQLNAEADYRVEAAHLTHFRALLADCPDFLLPQALQETLSNVNILVMSHVEGEPVEALQEPLRLERDRVVGLLFELLFREIFEFPSGPNRPQLRELPL